MAEQNGNQKTAVDKRVRFWKITAPSPEYSGIHPTGLRFEQGVALTRDQKAMEHCRDTGLTIEAVRLDPEAPTVGGGNPEGMPADDASGKKEAVA